MSTEGFWKMERKKKAKAKVSSVCNDGSRETKK
jgi:hypothetical protein